MDIAYYVSELLVELGEVNVPGLGNFTQRKIDGYYNDEEARFYPPAHVVHFNPNFVEDDILAEYIAEQKKISIASSRYFTEKYVNSVKQEAILKDVPLADLGSIRFVVHEFSFKSADKWANDPVFWGYPQITLKKIAANTVIHRIEDIEQAPAQELLPPAIHEEPSQEPEINTPVEIPQPSEATQPPVTAIPQELPEAEAELPAIINGTEDPAPISEYVAPPIVSEEPVKETEAIIVPEPARESESGEFDLEAYLRELEASAGIVSTETPAHEPEIEAEPVVVIHEPEVTVAEPEVTAPEPVEEIQESAPEMIIPETEPDITPLPTVELPQERYTPDPELQQYILDAAKPEPQPYTPKPEVEATASQEEDFVFNGKGYDDVDNPESGPRDYKWLWITLIIILVLGGVAGYLWYTHQQQVLKTIKANSGPLPIKIPLKHDTVDNTADSLKDTTQAAVIKDTTEKVVTAPVSASAIDSTKPRYELIGTRARTMAEANLRVTNYKSLGISDAHVLIPGPGEGKLIKVSLATFMNQADAINKRREILSTGNVSEIEIKKINPTK